MRLSLVNERPLRRARLPMSAVAARNSAADSARDLRPDSRPISIATRMRIKRFCSSVREAKRAAVSGLTGMAGRAMVFMMPVYGFSGACKSRERARSVGESDRRTAICADTIRRGAKSGDLAIEQPTKFHLVINMKTARALKLEISRELAVRADRVIE